jgi:hypothetical protein
MNRITVRTLAAILATAVTAAGLMGVKALAALEPSAGMPLLVLPYVEVIANKADASTHSIVHADSEEVIAGVTASDRRAN